MGGYAIKKKEKGENKVITKKRQREQKRILALIGLFVLFISPVRAHAASTAEDELIVRAVATSYPQADMGARVALCAVILNRLENGAFGESVAGIIMGLDSGFDPDKLCEEIDDKLYRITWDACKAARAGSDPTGGLLYFERLDGPGLGENHPAFLKKRDMGRYRVVIGDLGFY